MKAAIYIILTLIKVGVIIYFGIRILKYLINGKDQSSKRKAFIQFLLMFGILAVITILEFGIAFLISSAD